MAGLIEPGDYVTIRPLPDVWQVVWVRDGLVRVSPASITLAGRPRRTVNVEELERVTAAGDVF